ncbi:unnamed protein product, partial [Sphacelaria rigidula]
MYLGESGPLASQGLSEDAGSVYCRIDRCINWCKTLGVPRVWVSDTATHFESTILTRLREALHVDHRFTVAYSPWSNFTCERMVKEVVCALRSILLEQRRAV